MHTTGLYAQRMVNSLMGLQDLVQVPWGDGSSARSARWKEERIGGAEEGTVG